MKNLKILPLLFLGLLSLSGSVGAKNVSCSSKILLSPNQLNILLKGDRAVLKTGPLNKNINDVRSEVKGSSLKLAGRTGRPSSGYIFTYDAVLPGESLIIEKVSKFGKGGEKIETREFKVRVFDANKVPEVTIKALKENIGRYRGQFVRLTGVDRNWGKPEKAKEVWGTMLTRSDWILEDDTGAVYVSGKPDAQKGETFTLICKVVTPSDGKWALVYHKKLAAKDQSNTRLITKNTNEFAFDLYRRLELENKGKNIFFSPFSISDALAMTYAGARGNTEKQMAKVLRFSLPQEELHPAFSSLIERLKVKPGKKAYKLHIANALWGQKDYHFLEEFKALIDRYYNGGFYNVDFAGNTEVARKRINTWVEQKTEEKIKNLIAKGDIDSLTRLVLTNAIYFKGKWASQFKKKNTKPMPFHVTSKKSVKVPMMFQEGQFPYFENENLQVLELPYAGDELSMIILLPAKKDGLAELEQHLTEKTLSQWLAHLCKREIKVYMPRFKLRTKYYLARDLAAMGMPDAFSNRADFSGMTGHKELKISKVIHQAYVEVNEEGTEAAAATAVTMRLKAVMLHPIFRANHPFVFMIFHKKTGSILFVGKVVNP